MKHSATTLLILLHLSFLSEAQNDGNFQVAALNRQLINRKDTVYSFYALHPDRPIKTRMDRTYYWYRPDTILTTAGGYDGRILDGSFKIFYPDKNLKEQGVFRNGLRSGEWKSWYPGGQLREIVRWKDGLRDGPFSEYDAAGRKLREGHYKKDDLSGPVTEYSRDGTARSTTYQKGLALPPKTPAAPAATINAANKPAAFPDSSSSRKTVNPHERR
jgi:hypothetical protein